MNSQSMDTRKKTGKLLLEIGLLMVALTAVTGLGLYQAILSNWRVNTDGELFFQAFVQSGNNFTLTVLNQQSLYVWALSVFFSFLGNKEELVLVFNLILQLLGMVFFFYGAKKICSYGGSLCLLFTSIVASVAVYPINTDTPMHLIWMLCGCVLWISTYSAQRFKNIYVKYLLPGIIIGIGCYVDIAGFYLFAFVILLILVTKGYSVKEKCLQILYYLLCFVNAFFVMFYLWNNLEFNTELAYKWFNERISSYYTALGLYENIALGVILVLCLLFLLFKCSSVIRTATEVKPEETNMTEHVSFNTTDTLSKVSQPLKAEGIDASTEDTTDKEAVKPINYIPNPLPLPKKHVKKEMKYAFEPSPDMMHYDYNNYNIDDDYDLKEI